MLFYGNTKLNEYIRNTVWWLLWTNNLLHYFEDVYEKVLFSCFCQYVRHIKEYNPLFLEKVAIYNARHETIYEIIKLKKMLRLEYFEDYENVFSYTYRKQFDEIRNKLVGKISERALKFVEDLYNVNGKLEEIKDEYNDYKKLMKEVQKVLV
jgi:hypothetical protein